LEDLVKNSSPILLVAGLAVALLVSSSSIAAQQSSGASAAAVSSSAVPHLMSYSGLLKDANGKTVSSVTGMTFLLYKDPQGGAPVWMETQNVQPDQAGRYTVQLGATRSEGLPGEMFMTGEARWLAVQVTGETEQPRVLLVAVPYALKAADAETVGGLPPSAFLLAPAISSGTGLSSGSATPSSSGAPPALSNVTTTGGTVNAVPLFTTATNVQNSAIAQTGSGATARIGVGTTTPATTLDVKGAETVRGALTLPATVAATKTKGANSQPQDLVASSFSSTTSTAVNQNFQWRAEPTANNTANPSGTLNLLYGLGATKPTETGLHIGPTGQITFATGQTFPGTGAVSSVGLSAPSSDFTVSGSPVTSAGTLKVAWTVPPDSADTGNAIVKRDASGNFSAGSITSSNLNSQNAEITNSLSVDSAAGDPFHVRTTAMSGVAVEGDAVAAGTGTSWGVLGTTESSASTATGVYGIALSTTGSPSGVLGITGSPAGIGVFGRQGTPESSTGKSLAGNGAGTWGDGGSSQYGVIGTVDNYTAGLFLNNDPVDYTLYAGNLNSAGPSFVAINTANGTYCNVDSGGNLNCTGSKNAVVPIDGGNRIVAMSAIESPKNWFEDFGSAELSSGSAVVALDPDFIQTVNTEREYMVIPVPNGECKGLYVTNKTATSFEVRELGGGTSSIRFDYRIVALRRKYEDVRFADHTSDPDPRKMMERMRAERPQAPGSHESPIPLTPVHAAKLAPAHATTVMK
jgi:hypothetical protein